jgi:AcrR family transcriptional regulator
MTEDPPARRRRPANRRQEILAAATALADERGIGDVTLAELARKVNVTTPALYRHIGSKEGLTSAIAAGVLDELADALAAPGATRSLSDAVDTVLEVAPRHRGQLGAYLAIDPSYLDALPPDLRDAQAAEERLLTHLAPLLEVDGAVLHIRLRAMLAAVHALTVRAVVAQPRSREMFAGRLAHLLAGPPARSPAARDAQPARALPEPIRSTLLHAAVRLFRTRGYNSVGVDEIGAEAGLSGPSLYQHFSRKVDLLIEASDRSTIAVLDALERVLRVAPDHDAAATALAGAYARLAVDSVDLIVVTARESGNIPEDVRLLHQQRRRSVTDTWAELLMPRHPDLSRRSAQGIVAAGMSAARAAAVAGDTAGGDVSVLGEAERAVRALTCPADAATPS